MQELIKSKDVRKYLQEKNFCFTDYEKATLIYNSDWSMPGNVIHKLKVWEEADGKYQPAGYFASYASAERYAANCHRKKCLFLW